jgi:lipopolysaccharide biosynthesis regulator YciM
LNKTNLCNLCVIFLKLKDWPNVIKYADDALEVDSKFSRALFMKGKGHLEMTEFEKAVDALSKLVEYDP